MSSILKALKKLEEERTPQPANRPEHIARQAAHPTGVSGRNAKTACLLVSGILIGVLSVGGWLLWERKPPVTVERAAYSSAGPSTQAMQSPLESVTAPIGADGSTVAPLGKPPRSDLPSPSGPHPTPLKPAASRPRTAPPVAAATSVPADTADTVSASPVPSPEVVVEEIVRPVADVVAVAADGANPSPGPPAFRVTEIYHQPEGGSMAVVEGLPVMEGTMVNGAMVAQILSDRVRLVVDGNPVEILLETAP